MDDVSQQIATLSPKQRALLELRLKRRGVGLPKTQAIPKRKDFNALSLSFAQQRLWFIQQLDPKNASYNIPFALRLQGYLKIAVLQQTFNELVKRHETLRTRFITNNEGQPVQVIDPVQVTMPIVDLSQVSQPDLEVQRLATEAAQGPFDFTQLSLRLVLLHLGKTNHVLLLTMHHIISDRWSLGVLVRELKILYEAFSDGKPSPLAELPIQYADWAIWQRQHLQGEVLQHQLNYWKQQLGDNLPVLEFPTDRARPAIPTFRGSWYPVVLSRSLTTALKQLSAKEGVTLFVVLLATFKLLLHKYSNQEDIVVGTDIANRNRIETEGLIGFLINTLVLRTQLSGNPTFRELLQRVREVTLEAYAHQDLPFERLVEFLNPERTLSQMAPLFQAKLDFQLAAVDSLELSNLTLSFVPIESETTKFELRFNLAEAEQGIQGKVEYSTDLFDGSTIARLVTHFRILLESIVSYPEQHLSEFSVLGETERQQLLVEWNKTQIEYPKSQCIHQLFEEQVEQTPDAVALVFEEEQLSYQELNQRANQLAHYLQSLGVGPERLVGVCLERSPELVIALLSILKAGGAYVPLDPTYPPERIAYILEDAQVPILLTQAALLESLPSGPHTLCLDADWTTIAACSSTNPASAVHPEHLSYVIYTSGSTGQPKGAMNTHRGVCNRLRWMQDAYHLTSHDRVLQKTPFSFDVSVWEFFWPLMAGAPLVVAQPGGHQDSHYLAQLIVQEHISTLHFVPSMLQVFLEEPQLEPCNRSLKRVLCSGEALPLSLQQRCLGHLEAELHNLYGPTEAAIDVTAWHCQAQGNETSVPIGRPIANTQIYVLDATGHPVPLGVSGELHIGGVQLARGYWQRPELTAEKFIPHPFRPEPGARLYKTGDLVRYRANGELEYLGRLDHQVKIRGFRIELGEIESVLAQHPDVSQAAVLAQAIESRDQQLIAYVVPHPEVALSVSELRRFLQGKLPEYMVPAAFIELDALPLTPNGKLDRRALPAPEKSYLSTAAGFVAPRTPIEEVLANIWAEVLDIESIGIHANIFELGGHSLLATRVISQVRQAFQVEIPLRCLFESPTIADFATTIETALTCNTKLTAPPIERIKRTKKLPLSFAQQRLWFLAQLEPESPFYNIPTAVRLQGTLNIIALQQSLNEIVNRHEVLRLAFQTGEGEPTAVLSPGTQLSLSVVDLRELPSTKREAAVRMLAHAEAQHPFSLDCPPLLRATLLQLQADEQVLLFTLHHIVSDGWSIGVLVREVAALYEACCQGEPSPLPALPIQYVDFAAWQRQWLQGEVLEQQQRYWQQQLAGAPSMLELPTDYPRPAIQTFRGTSYSFEVSPELTQVLKQVSRQSGCTLFMTLLAAFQVVLGRYSGQDDIVVGSPIANRNRAEVEGLIGFFVNTLVLRTQLSGHPSFKEVLERVREVTLRAYAHQDVPFEQVVELLQPERSLSHTPLFQVMFSLQNAPTETLKLRELSLEFLPADSDTAKLDLTLAMQETDLGLVGRLEYNTDLFEEATIERMAAHLQQLLEGIVEQPEQCIWGLPLLTATEQHQLLREWNKTQIEYPKSPCIHQLFEEQVERTKDAIAVVFAEQQLSYQELNTRANQLAHYLQSLGVEPETLVGVCIERSIEMVIALLGILKARGAYVPLDPSYPPERTANILEDAQVPILLTQAALLESLPSGPHTLCLDADWTRIAACSSTNPDSAVHPEHLSYVIYTSGSTGQPKGVQIPHRALTNFLHSMAQRPGLTPDDRLLSVTTIAFDIAALELYLPLMRGARLGVVSRQVALDGVQLSRMLDEYQVTTLQATPATWQLLVATGWLGTPSLRILCGGEALSRELASQLLDKSVAVWNLYGPTETTIWSAVSRVEPDSAVVPLGQPIANTQLYVLDASQQPVPVGVPGELHIGGLGLARGYSQRPELTAERFIPNPFSAEPGTRLYKTGDLVRYRADGVIEYLGRLDHQVKIRGFRIELGEIENMLSQHPAVSQAAVIARTSDQGDRQFVTYTVPHPEATLTISELRRFLRDKLPEYMVPAAWVMLDALPLTPNGKVDRKALPVPEQQHLSTQTHFVAPRTPIEEVIVGIWTQVLDVEQVGVYDNFFEQGGHSLLATQLTSRLRNVFQIELPLRSIFEFPTVEALAESIEVIKKSKEGLHAPPILPVPRDGNLPLSFAQERLWFLEQLEPNNNAYNNPSAVCLTGSLNVAALEQGLNEIVRRHEVLRTTFTSVEGKPYQIIIPTLTLKLPMVDLQELPETEQETEVLRLAAREADLPFDLGKEILLRVKLLKLGEAEHVVLFTMHHIVIDAWSIGILIQEISTLYESYYSEKADLQQATLPELSVQYADFAHWQRQWLDGEVLEEQLSYWRQQLAGAPTTLDLQKIAGIPPLTTQTEECAAQSFLLSTHLSEQLRTLSRQEGVTLFMTLLAAFQTLLYRYTNQDDIVVGTDVANRNRAEIEPLVGFFVNLLVLRSNLSGNPTFRELLERVREVTLGAYAHQDLPFAKLVENLRPDRAVSETPLFQVLFVLQNTPMPAVEFSGLTLTPIEVNRGKARFDLALFMQETEQGIVGNWKYRANLFETEAIARLSDHFQTLLHSIAQYPNTKIDTLEMLSESEKQQQIAEKTQHEQAQFKKFKTIKPKTVSLPQKELIKTGYLQPEQNLPYVIQPDGDDIDLADWAISKREFIETNLLKHGAILFRDFELKSVFEFEKVASAICPELFGEYGDLPREGISDKVYGSTPYPSDQAILFHNESSHLHQWPLKIWFFCVQPAQQGGETPIVDCRKVYQLLNPKLRERFEQKQLMYVRNYIEGLDVSWQDFFHTTDKTVVEKSCRQSGIDFEWLSGNGLRTRKVRPAISQHPKTGESVFFNQVQLHHVSCLEPSVRASLLSTLREENLPRNVYYGDGSPIEDCVMAEIGAIYQEAKVSFPWQQGDVLMLDNMLTAHGRNPYQGSRKIVVAMGVMISSKNS